MVEVEGLNIIRAKINRIIQEPLLSRDKRAKLVLAGIALPLQKDPVQLKRRTKILNRVLDSMLTEIRQRECRQCNFNN